MSLYFNSCGFLTTIQDGGRFGYQDIGISPSGPMDRRAFNLGNVLVGNSLDEGAFEMTLTGPFITFGTDCTIAVTGADLSAILDSYSLPMYQAVEVKSGQTLQFGKLLHGLRSYLAISGGLDIPEIMGSQSTLLRNHIGGFNGRSIQNGDVVRLRSPQKKLKHMNSRIFAEKLKNQESIDVRVIRGPQDSRFTQIGIETFFSESYVVTNELDRMGCRLGGPKIEHISDANIISDGVVTGSIQIPGNGLPIVMLADRQSTGGYTKIATVITVDLPKMAQVKPGNKIRFIETNIKHAQKLFIKEKKMMKKLELKWSANKESI